MRQLHYQARRTIQGAGTARRAQQPLAEWKEEHRCSGHQVLGVWRAGGLRAMSDHHLDLRCTVSRRPSIRNWSMISRGLGSDTREYDRAGGVDPRA